MIDDRVQLGGIGRLTCLVVLRGLHRGVVHLLAEEQISSQRQRCFVADAFGFDVRDGRALCAPAYEPVAKFPTKVEHGGVWTRDDRD